MRAVGPAMVVLLSTWASLASLASGAALTSTWTRAAGLGSALRVPNEITRGSWVALVHDVAQWSGSLRHGEVGVVQSVDDSASHGFKRFLVRRPDGAEVWHEQDELQLTRTQAHPDHIAAASEHAQTLQSGSVSCTLNTFYPVNVTASSESARAAELAGRAPTASMQDCTSPQIIASWLPTRNAPGGMWLEAHLGERMHIKDLTVYKRGVTGLIRRIEGFEPRYDGHKARMLFDGVDNIACGKLVVRMPELTLWSVDRLHFAIAPVGSWTAPVGAAREHGGIVSIEVLGLVDSCYPAFIGESKEATKLRKRMEAGFTGCSFSGVSFSEADRRIGGDSKELVPGESDIGTCGDL